MKTKNICCLMASGPLSAELIHIESIYRRGLPNFLISGMSGSKIRELSERIRTTIISSGFSWPLGQIQVHLSPADLPKSGSHLDLAIAVSLLRCFGVQADPKALLNQPDVLYLGELSLNGEILPIAQSALLALKAARHGFKYLAICESDLEIVRYCQVNNIIVLKELSDVLKDPADVPNFKPRRLDSGILQRPPLPDAPVALEVHTARAIAACCAGEHSMLMIGPPGSGKSTLARFLHALLPAPNEGQGLELMQMNYQRYTINQKLRIERPLLSPHHSCTTRAMIGGGQPLMPGEVTRAHHGILLLDELSEFKRNTLQSLREPLLDKCIYLSRGNQTVTLPTDFLLVATSNPCPCGYFGSNERQCKCITRSINQYMHLLLGPLRDRIEIELFVGNKINHSKTISIQDILAKIDRADQIQKARYARQNYTKNSRIPLSQIDEFGGLDNDKTKNYWRKLLEEENFSQRAALAIRRLARTLADLDSAAEIRVIDLFEASRLRLLDSFYLDNGQ